MKVTYFTFDVSDVKRLSHVTINVVLHLPHSPVVHVLKNWHADPKCGCLQTHVKADADVLTQRPAFSHGDSTHGL